MATKISHPETWDRVHMDLVKYNSKHFLVVIDAYSKWPEVRYMSSTSAPHLVKILEEIFAFHGFPRLVVSDNGPQFVSHELQEYLTAHQILHHRSAPYHPATNGLAEGMVKNIKQWLRKQVSCMLFIYFKPCQFFAYLPKCAAHFNRAFSS